MKANNLLTTWTEFISSLRSQFGASLFDDHQGALSKLSQKGTVAEFQTAFAELMNQVKGVSEPLLVSFFISGLKSDVRREMSFAKPANLMETFA